MQNKFQSEFRKMLLQSSAKCAILAGFATETKERILIAAPVNSRYLWTMPNGRVALTGGLR